VTVGVADPETAVDGVVAVAGRVEVGTGTDVVVVDADRVVVGACGAALLDPLLQAESSTSATHRIPSRPSIQMMAQPPSSS